MSLVRLRSRIKQLNNKFPVNNELQEFLYDEALKKVLRRASDRELSIASGSQKYGPVTPKESKHMQRVLHNRALSQLKK